MNESVSNKTPKIRKSQFGYFVTCGEFCSIGCGVVIDKNVTLDDHVRIFNNSVIRNDVHLHEHVTIGHLVVVEGNTTIGEYTTIQSQCHITAHAIIEDHVFFGPGVIMTNESNIAGQGRDIKQNLQTAHIKHGARIGAGCLILPGVTIGENAFVGAGSLITKDIPAGELWMGRPASFISNVPKGEWI